MRDTNENEFDINEDDKIPATGRKKRSIRDIPITKKTKSTVTKAEKAAKTSQVTAIKKAKKLAEKAHKEDDDNLDTYDTEHDNLELDPIEIEEEEHYKKILAEEKSNPGSKSNREDIVEDDSYIDDNTSSSDYDADSKWRAEIDMKNEGNGQIPTSSQLSIKRKGRKGKKMVAFLIICIITAMALGQTVFAKANIAISTKPQQISLTETALPNQITYNSFVKNSEKTVEVEEIKTVSVSKKATGTITLYNNFSTAPYDLVKTTRVQTANGSVYRLLSDVSIPGKKGTTPGTITAKVEADLPGDIYNAKAGLELRLPGLGKGTSKYNNIYAKTASNFTGGQSGTALDTGSESIKNAVETAKIEAETEAVNQFRSENPNFTIIKDSVETTTSLGPINKDETGGKVIVRITTKAIGLSKDELKTNIQSILSPQGKNVIDDEIEKLNIVVSETSNQTLLSGAFNVKVSGDMQVKSQLNPDSIKSEIALKSIKEANQIIEGISAGSDVKVSVWPFWKRKIPSMDKIQITITE